MRELLVKYLPSHDLRTAQLIRDVLLPTCLNQGYVTREEFKQQLVQHDADTGLAKAGRVLTVVSMQMGMQKNDFLRQEYFEMFVNRGIYHRGWTAVTRHSIPWMMSAELPPINEDVWELYGPGDWAQANDLSEEMPEMLHELQRLFLIEAARYNVLPLDDWHPERFNADFAGRPVSEVVDWEDYEGWTAGKVRAGIAAIGRATEEDADELLEYATDAARRDVIGKEQAAEQIAKNLKKDGPGAPIT